MEKLNNYVLFLLALSVPFYEINHSILKYLLFQNIFPLLILYYFVFAIVLKRKFITGKPGKLSIAVVLLFLTQVASGLFAFDTDLAIEKIYVEFQFTIIFLVVNGLIINNDCYEYIVKGLLVGFVISCLIGILQYLGFKQFNIFTTAELNANAGLVSESRSLLVRIWGPFGNSLTFSEYLAVVGLALYSYYRFIKKNRVIAFGLIAVAFFCIALTVGRIALFSAGFSFLLIEYLYAKGTSYARGFSIVIAFFAIGLIGFMLLSPGIQDNGNPLITRFSNASQDLKEGRLNLWVKGFAAFSKNIFLGVGPGNLHLALSSEGFPMTSAVIAQFDGQHVENYYLTILYTYGIIGFYFCLRIFYFLVKYSYRLFIRLKEKSIELAWGGIMYGGIIALIICNITNPALIFEQRIKMLFIILIAVVNNSFLSVDRKAFFERGKLFVNPFRKKAVKIS